MPVWGSHEASEGTSRPDPELRFFRKKKKRKVLQRCACPISEPTDALCSRSLTQQQAPEVTTHRAKKCFFYLF